MDSNFYPLNSNILAPSWRLSKYDFSELFGTGKCPMKATYFSPTISLAALASSYNNTMQIDQFSDFVWNEWRFALVNVGLSSNYPNVQVRLRDSLGRRICPDFIDVPQACGTIMGLMFPRATQIFIDAQADDAPGIVPADIATIQFQLIFKGFKLFDV